jgi:predicted dehydrogenase
MIPDPNNFGGEIKVFRPETGGWQTVPFSHHYNENSRIIGAADMAEAIIAGRPHRSSGELAYHVLEVMLAFEKLGKEGGIYQVKSTCEKPLALKVGSVKGILE